MGVDIELQRGRIICNLANRTVVIGLVLEVDVAFGDEGVALFFIPRIPCLRAGERLIALVVVKDEDSLAVCDEFLRIFLIDRDIFFAAIGIAGVVGLIRVCRDVVLIHAAEQRVIEHIFGAHRVEAGCGEGVVVLDGAEVYLHTRGLVLGAEEVEGDAEVEKTLALLVEEGGSDGDVVRRRIDVNADGDVGQHLFEGRRRVGCDKTHDELEEARARLQGYLAGEHVEQHRRLVGIAHRFRSCNRFGSARAAEQLAEVDLVVQEGLQRIVGEVDLELRARTEDPAEVCVQRRAVDDVVCVVVVTDVPHVAHIVESEHVREGVVRRFGAPEVDGKLQTRDVEGVVIRLVPVVDLDRRADLEGQHCLIAVGHGEERVHVAEDRPQHLVHGRAAVRMGVVLGETLVLGVILIELDILPSHEDVLRLGQSAEVCLFPLLRGVVGHVLTEGDGAADGEVDGIQLAGVAVLDVLAVVVDDLAGRVLVVVCRKPRLEFAVHATALFKDRACIRHGGEPARRGAVHEGEVVALVDGAVVVDGRVRRQVAERVDVVVGCVVAVHIGVGRRVEVGMELGHADEGCGPVAHVVALALTHIGVGVAVVVPCIDVRRRHGHVGGEALRLHLDVQVVRIGICDEVSPRHVRGAVRAAQIARGALGARGDGVVLAAVVEVDLAVRGARAYDCGHVDELLVPVIVALVLAHIGVGVVLCRRLGHVDAEGEAVTPQPHARLDEGLGVLGRIHHPDVLEVNAAVHRAQHGITVHGFIVFDIEDEGARKLGIADLRRHRAVEPFRLHPFGVGRLGREDVVAVHVEVGLDGRDVPIAELGDIVCRLFRVGHIVAQTQIALTREGVGVDIVHAVRVVAIDGEAGVREVDLLERRPGDGALTIRPRFQRRVEVVVDVDVDAQIRLVELEVVVKRASFGSQQNVEQLVEVISLKEDPDVGGRDAHAVDERLDVRRDLLREQRQLDVDAAAQQFAEVNGQREPAFVRRAVSARRGDRFGRSAEVAEAHFFAHHAADERHQLGEVHVDAGLTEVAEIDVQTCVGTHLVTVHVGIEEGAVTGVSRPVVVRTQRGEELVLARLFVIAVVAVLGREVVGVAVLTLVLVFVIILAFVAAQRQVDSEHGMLRHTVVGDGGELHGRVDEVEEVLKTDEVVHIRIFVVDVAVRCGHLLGADEAADDIDEGDEVDVAGEASESHSRAVLVIAQVVGRRKAAQIVEERAQLELEGHGEIESAQDLGRGVAARHRGEHRVEVEVAVREEIFKQRGEVDGVAVQRREEQLERDGFAE